MSRDLNRREWLTMAGSAALATAARTAEPRPATPASTITEIERQRALGYLVETRAMFLTLTANLSEGQWRFKPSPEVWSPAEITEHVTVVEEAVLASLRQSLAGPPLPPESRPRLKDDAIILVVTNRDTHRLQAPEVFKPSRRWPGQREQIAAFEGGRARTVEYVTTTEDDLRAHVRDTPLLGPIDCYQMLLFVSGHSERHAKQIRELQANPLFPEA